MLRKVKINNQVKKTIKYSFLSLYWLGTVIGLFIFLSDIYLAHENGVSSLNYLEPIVIPVLSVIFFIVFTHLKKWTGKRFEILSSFFYLIIFAVYLFIAFSFYKK